MSSLKDIMDVDVEPLQSQAAYRRSREAAQQASRSSIATSSEVISPPTDDEDIDPDNTNKGKHPIKRRRSHRVASGTEEASRSDTQDQRESAAAGQDMDYQTSYQAMGSGPASGSGTPQNMSRSSESGSSIPVKYTPVTGRISRAKKGVPVHTCETCRPAKTFTRAEHLRRHQLSHQKPAYGCTFENCERAFHRPDLLARHMHRHETQGEKPYVSGDRSREPSSHSDTSSQPLAIKAERFDNNPSSPDASTPRTANSMGNMSSTTITQQSLFPNYSPGGAGSKRTADQANLPDMYPVTSPGSNRPHASFNLLSSTVFTAADLPVRGGNFPGAEPVYEEMYTGGEAFPPNYTTAGSPLSNSGLPLLRIPDEPYPTTNAYGHDTSPFCSSSASDSTFSNQSEGPLSTRWGRGRSNSGAEWPISATSAWSPQLTTPQDLSSPPFEFNEQFEPRISAPRSHVQHLDVPYGGYFLESVGTPTLSTNSKPISQVFPASTSRVPNSRLAGTNTSREKLETINFSSTTIPFQQSQTPSLYIDTYWQNFHPRFPIIHRPTYDSAEGSLLTTAMAAIGTQYHHTREARIKGSELNESCRKGLDQCLNWTLETMQAILLTEIFSRFRGRKTTIRLSRRFEELCSRLLHGTDSSYGALTCSSPVDGASVADLRERFGLLEENQSLQQQPTPPNEWRQWIEAESRQRLLNACFMFDVHQALYHQQPRSKALGTELRPFLVSPTPETDSLWGATDASKWQSQQSLQLLQRDPTNHQLSTESSSFSQSLLICSLATQLPLDVLPSFPRFFHSPPAEADIASTFTSSPLAQTYLALHHTRLHDLLAVAADTWIFSHKVTPPQAFQDAQKRLHAWSKSMDAAHAVHHACRVLSLSLTQSQSHSNSCHTNGLVCITEYWSLYVSALICWAFGHRYQVKNSKTSNVARTNSSGALSTDAAIDSAQGMPVEEAQAQANFYITSMLEFSVEELPTNGHPIKGETSGIIDMVRQRLNFEGINTGGRCSMLSDCIGVLQKISKSGNSRWF